MTEIKGSKLIAEAPVPSLSFLFPYLGASYKTMNELSKKEKKDNEIKERLFHLSHGAGEGAGTIGHSEDTVVSLIETKMPCIRQFPPKSLLFGLLTLLTFVSRVWGPVE